MIPKKQKKKTRDLCTSRKIVSPFLDSPQHPPLLGPTNGGDYVYVRYLQVICGGETKRGSDEVIERGSKETEGDRV